MPGYNFFTYKQRFIREVQGRGGQVVSPANLPDTIMAMLFNDALALIQDRRKIDEDRNTGNIAASTMEVDVPTDLLGKSLTQVQVLGISGTGQTVLTELAYEDFVDRFNIDDPTNNRGIPTHYTFAVANQRQILLGPSPSYTRADGVIFLGLDEPDQMFRSYYSAAPPDGAGTFKCTVSKSTSPGSIAIAGTSTPTDPVDVFIEDGDEIGIVMSNQSDGASITGLSPVKWYTIASQTTGGTGPIVLVEAFDQQTQTSKDFVTGQVSDLELAYPGMMRWLPVTLALKDYFMNKNPQLSAYYDLESERGFKRLNPVRPRAFTMTNRPTAGQGSFA